MADGILNPIEQLEADLDFEVYTKQEVDALLDEKADKSDTYTKTETDALLDEKADADAVYTKTETDTLLSAKADADNVYTKTETNNLLNGKADKSTTLAGYGITDAYTKTQTDNLLNAKANADSVYTKAEIDTELTVTKDGTWVKGTQTTATNLQKLEGGIEYLYGLLSHQYDQLKKYINGNYYDYDTDTDSKYVKTVPQGAMPYASLDSIGGKTLVWNQLVNPANFIGDTTLNYLTLTNNGDGTLTVNGTASATTMFTFLPSANGVYIPSGHKGLLKGCPAGASSTTYRMVQGGLGLDTGDGVIATSSATAPAYIQIIVSNGVTCNNVKFAPQSVDLTLLYGAGNEPTTVEEFEAMFPASYYPYNAGTLLSAGVTEVKSVGINVWDEQWEVGGVNVTTGIKDGATNRIRSKNFIPVQSGVSYYFNGLSLSENMVVLCYTYDKTYTGTYYYRNVNQSIQTLPQGTAFILFCMVAAYGTTYRNDICIHVSSASTNGKYYPYQENTYPIPAEIQALEGYGWSAGSVYNYVDFERKVFVQRVASYTFDGTETWTYYPQGDKNTFNSGNRFLTDVKKFGNGIMVEYTKSDAQYIASQDNLTFQFFNTPYISIRNDAYTDATTFASYMSGKTIYYELDTPIETDISAYLTDDNLISVESGGTLTFPNSNGTDYQIPVPSAETYMVDLQSAI